MKKMLLILACWLAFASLSLAQDESKFRFMTTSDDFKWEVDWGVSLYQDFNSYRGEKSTVGTYIQMPVVQYKYASMGFGLMVLPDDMDRSRPMFSLMVGKNEENEWFSPRIGVSVLVSPYDAMAVCVDLISVKF